MKTIIHALDVEASAQAVHDAFTTLEGLAGWWTTKVEGDPTEGGVVDFTFRGDFHPDMRVDRVDDSIVEWTCVGGHEPWADNTFSFELDGSSPVRVLMRQGYARELDDRTYGTSGISRARRRDRRSSRRSARAGTGTARLPLARSSP